MRRLVGVLVAGAFAAALLPSIASASFAPMTASAFDLRPQLMLRLFGESSDSRAALAAAYGDRTSESPLRDLALQVEPHHRSTAFFARDAVPADPIFDLAQAMRNRALQANLHFSVPSPPSADAAPASLYGVASTAPAATFTVGEYRPVPPVPLVSPQPGSFAFGPSPRQVSFSVPEGSTLALGAGSALPGAATSAVFVPATVHVGPVQVQTRVGSASLNAPQLSLNDNGYGAGANFNVRAGARNVNVDLSSAYERLTRNDSSGAPPAAGASSWQLPGADAPLVIPNYANLNKISIGAAVAVPVVSGLTLNLNYAADRMFGGYGLPGAANLDTTGNSYGGKLIFDIPHSSSELSISARQLRYQDSVLSPNALSQTREDVNFTVKF